MSQTKKLGKTGTVCFKKDNFTVIKYHETKIVKFNQNKVILNSGNWRTKTTKLRINQAANQFNLDFNVFQKDFKWFVETPNGIVDFKDNMTLNY